MRYLVVVLIGLIAVTSVACGSAEKDYVTYLYQQCDGFKEVLSEPQTENWSPTRSSLQDALAKLQEVDKSLSQMKAPTERTRRLAAGLQALVRGLKGVVPEALNLSPASDAASYYRASVGAISYQLYEGEVYTGIVDLAMQLGVVTTTTGYGTGGTMGGD